ncbi:MAG: hypothetical protein AAFX87_06810 [Bacteroidota bacterium]
MKTFSLVFFLCFMALSAFSNPHTAHAKSTLEADSTYTLFVFGYYYGDEGAVLLTEMAEIEVPYNEKVTTSAQQYLLRQKNSGRFIRYIKKEYPDEAKVISGTTQVLFISDNREEAFGKWEEVGKARDNNTVYIYDFKFERPFSDQATSDFKPN